MLTYNDLVNDMETGCKPRESWRIGIEHEQFLYLRSNGDPLPYDGAPGIRQVLKGLIDDHGWAPVVAQGHVIALEKGRAAVTLEPGGQIEFSGAPLETMDQVRREASAFYAALDDVTDGLGIGIMARGFHPTWRREQIHTMPKARYAIMRPYMEKKGRYGVDMMLRTCGAQVNLDFSSEADMVRKFRVALALQPAMIALLANSSRAEGVETGYASYRALMWTDTDLDRCGVPLFVFDDGMGFARYVDYALDVPMYFVIRDGQYINVAGQSFRAFMDGTLPGLPGERPTLDDWHDHLTTLFPEVRLKKYLELRGPDSAPAAQVYGMAAFWTGIFHDSDALEQAWDLVRGWGPAAHAQTRLDVVRHGMATLLPDGRRMAALASEAIAIADGGLARQSLERGARDDLATLAVAA